MNKTLLIIFIFCCIPFLASLQVKVILDTDPSFDPDDVGCMAMLHTMASLGECQILAIINSTNQKESPLSISAINTFYNRKGIPVGDYKGYKEKVGASEFTYDYHLANEYLHSLKSWEEAIDGVALYREILASAEDSSIVVAIIGTMHNFYALLKSEPDKFSELSGPDLVRRKVKLVATMGGNFIEGRGYDRTNWGGADALCEYTDWSCLNEERNRMCRYVIDNCPAPFMASGWEVGCGDYHDAEYGNVMTGQNLKKLDTTHIVRRSYEYHFRQRGGDENISRHSNDQCALHYAVRGASDNYTAYTNGKITLSATGVCTWDPSINRGQGYIQKKRDKDLIAAEIDQLMMGDVPEPDLSPPPKPNQIDYTFENNQMIISWVPVEEGTPGSWIAGYAVYKDKVKIGMAYGTRFVDENPTTNISKYEIRAVNVSGVESKSKSKRK